MEWLYHKIKEIDDKVIICFISADKNYIEELGKGILDIEKIVLYKPVLLKDLKNKIDWLLSRQQVNNKPTMMILWHQLHNWTLRKVQKIKIMIVITK